MPILVLNNWQGMLGNSILQVYNVLLIAIYNKYNIRLPNPTDKHKFSKYSRFYKTRDIIINTKSNKEEIKNRYNFYYQEWMPEYNKCFKTNNDIALAELKKLLTICDEDVEPIPDDTLVLHMRSGDIFANCPHPQYIPPPLSFYKEIIEATNYKNIIIATENGRNPCLKPLQKMDNVEWSGGDLKKDIRTIMGAKHIIFGIGSFVPALLLLSNNVEKIYVPNNYGVPRILEGKKCLFGKKVKIKQYDISDYLDKMGDKGVRSRYSRDLMLHYPKEIPKPKNNNNNNNNSKPKNNNNNNSPEKILFSDDISDEELKSLKLKKIIIRAGQYLDGVIFFFDNDKKRIYGGIGGKVVKEIELEDNEIIKSVQQIYNKLYFGLGIIFKTSKDKEYKITGKKGYSGVALMSIMEADKDKELVGLKLDGNKIIGIETR